MSTARPFHGLEPFVLGRTREQLRNLAGEPDAIRAEEFADGSKDEVWTYSAAGVEVAFSDVDEWRLASVTVESPDVDINGAKLIGMPVNSLVEEAGKGGIVDIEEADGADAGSACFVSDAHGLMLWAVGDAVASVTLFPQYDESGEHPCWPDAAS